MGGSRCRPARDSEHAKGRALRAACVRLLFDVAARRSEPRSPLAATKAQEKSGARSRGCSALQSLQPRWSPCERRRSHNALREWLPVQSSAPPTYRGHCFRDPASPLAPCLGRAVFRRRIATSTVKRSQHPLSGFRLPQSLAQRVLVSRPQPTNHSPGLSLPSAHARLGSPLRRGSRTSRCGPPAGFGYPLGGFRLPRPGRPCFVPTALLGFTLRSFLRLTGTASVSAQVNPHTVLPAGIPSRRSDRAGPAGRGYWVLTLSSVPGRRRCLADQRLDAPLGFALLGLTGQRLARDFARTPPTCLDATAFAGRVSGTSECQSNAAWPRPATQRTKPTGGTALSGFSHRTDPATSEKGEPWLCVHRKPRPALPPTDRLASGSAPPLPERRRRRLRCTASTTSTSRW